MKPNLTLNYGLRWELNTPYYDTGNRLQTFRPGKPQYSIRVFESRRTQSANLITTYGSTTAVTTDRQTAVFPLGFVFPAIRVFRAA